MVLGQLMFFALLCSFVPGSERAVCQLTLISMVFTEERTCNTECPIKQFTVYHPRIFLAAALRSRSQRSGHPMSHVRPHADVWTIVVEK